MKRLIVIEPSNPSPKIDAALSDRFLKSLEEVWPLSGKGRLGVAVSGGPDSLALLFLAHAALPGRVEAATIDHGLRPESGDEAHYVARICAGLSVPHANICVDVASGNLQHNARDARYKALTGWSSDRRLDAVATAHHADDQVETILMRLNRGSGVRGLSGIRASTTVPNTEISLIRPLLSWRKYELMTILDDLGIEAVNDPSNADTRFDRVALRNQIKDLAWLDAAAFGKSAKLMAEADAALSQWAHQEWSSHVTSEPDRITYTPGSVPRIIQHAVVERAFLSLGASAFRGGAIARLVDALAREEGGNVAGILATSHKGIWTFTPEPVRR